MSYIKDLEICDILPVESNKLIAIGWLDSGNDFEKGEVSKEFFLKLKKICNKPWEPFVSGGLHSCKICQFDGPSYNSNIFIPYNGKIYVSPTAIEHYIGSHRYAPPEIFIQAVMSCPEIRTIDYKKQILSNGGRILLQRTN